MTKVLEPGSELHGGKYRIVRLLGQGGVGSVFEARQRETDKRVAIKWLNPAHVDDSEVSERLLREARATARIRHPNVVDVYDVDRDGRTVYLVMEYLEGETLSQALARGSMPMHVTIGLLVAAMRGVAAAHAQGVIHRDIKPDNIFLAQVPDTPRPVPKVLDFGISKIEARSGDQRRLTRAGIAIGTPGYMSYEQLTGEEHIDGRADVYAFGVILYEALTGRVPYDAPTIAELLGRISTRAPTQPHQLRQEIPSTLSNLIMWALARDRNERVEDMQAFIRELDPFATEHVLCAERTAPKRAAARVPTPSACAASAEEVDLTSVVVVDAHASPSQEQSISQPRQLRVRWMGVLLLLLMTVGAVLLARRGGSIQDSRAPEASEASPLTAAELDEERRHTPAPADPPTVPLPRGVAPPEGEPVSHAPAAASSAPQPDEPKLPPRRIEVEHRMPTPARAAATPHTASRPRDLGIY